RCRAMTGHGPTEAMSLRPGAGSRRSCAGGERRRRQRRRSWIPFLFRFSQVSVPGSQLVLLCALLGVTYISYWELGTVKLGTPSGHLAETIFYECRSTPHALPSLSDAGRGVSGPASCAKRPEPSGHTHRALDDTFGPGAHPAVLVPHDLIGT